jgi:hypothetical protein
MLLDKLKQNGLLDELGNIILVVNEDGSGQTVDVTTFQTFFSNSETYDELIGQHTFVWDGQQLTKTGIELGYKDFFDSWKEKGVIS